NASDTSGGGIYTQAGKLNFTNSTLSGNTSARGAGLVTDTIPGAQDFFENSTISGNSTTDMVNGRGGGLAMFGFESGVGYTKFTLRNCTVTNNTSVGFSGGGIHLSGSSNNPVLVESSIISGNFNPPNAGTMLTPSPDFYGPAVSTGATAPSVIFNNSLVGNK